MTSRIMLAPLLLLFVAPLGGAKAGEGYGSARAHYRHHHGGGYGAPSERWSRSEAMFFPGAGDDAPRARRVIVAEYGEPYLPPGVLYNIPGPPPLAVGSAVIRAKY